MAMKHAEHIIYEKRETFQKAADGMDEKDLDKYRMEHYVLIAVASSSAVPPQWRALSAWLWRTRDLVCMELAEQQ